MSHITAYTLFQSKSDQVYWRPFLESVVTSLSLQYNSYKLLTLNCGSGLYKINLFIVEFLMLDLTIYYVCTLLPTPLLLTIDSLCLVPVSINKADGNESLNNTRINDSILW